MTRQHDEPGKRRVRKSLRILLLGTIALVGTTGCGERAGEPEQTAFLVKIGTMEAARPGLDRLEETQRITMDPARRPGFCFLVDPPDDQKYEVYSVTHLPGPPQQLTGDFAGRSESPAGLRSAPARVGGIHPFCFDFDRGDPLGEYRIEVFINGSRHTELRIEVVE